IQDPRTSPSRSLSALEFGHFEEQFPWVDPHPACGHPLPKGLVGEGGAKRRVRANRVLRRRKWPSSSALSESAYFHAPWRRLATWKTPFQLWTGDCGMRKER